MTSIEATLNSSMERLREMVSSRFGKNVRLRTMVGLEQKNSSQSFSKKGSDALIPLHVENNVVAHLVVEKIDDLSDDAIQRLAQITRMTVEPSVHAWYVEKERGNMKDQETFKPQMSALGLDQDFEIQSEPAVAPLELVSHLILLQSKTPLTIKKAALSLHEVADYWAFVPFNDLKAGFTGPDDIKKLGPMTLFIENIDELTPQDQELILNYMDSEPADADPCFVCGTSLTTEELADFPVLMAKLRDELLVNTLDLDRSSLEAQHLREILSLFFFKSEPV